MSKIVLSQTIYLDIKSLALLEPLNGYTFSDKNQQNHCRMFNNNENNRDNTIYKINY